MPFEVDKHGSALRTPRSVRPAVAQLSFEIKIILCNRPESVTAIYFYHQDHGHYYAAQFGARIMFVSVAVTRGDGLLRGYSGDNPDFVKHVTGEKQSRTSSS